MGLIIKITIPRVPPISPMIFGQLFFFLFGGDGCANSVKVRPVPGLKHFPFQTIDLTKEPLGKRGKVLRLVAIYIYRCNYQDDINLWEQDYTLEDEHGTHKSPI